MYANAHSQLFNQQSLRGDSKEVAKVGQLVS